MEKYSRGATPKLYATINKETLNDDGTLSTGALVNPDSSIQVIIEDSTGTVVQVLAAMTQWEAATGKYYYQGYTIPAGANKGVWNYEVVATAIGGYVSIGRGSFEVVEQVV